MIRRFSIKIAAFIVCFFFANSILAQSSIRLVHEVQKGETLYSLSKEYSVTIDEIIEVNPELSPRKNTKVKRGYLLNIPYSSKAPQQSKTINAKDTFSIAVVLPFASNNTISERVVEYYRGILLATHAAKSAGYSVEVSAFEEPSQKESIQPLLDEVSQSKFDFIVGPLYPTHFNDICDFAKNNKQRTIIPFSSKVSNASSNPFIYLLNTPGAMANRKIAQLFDATFKPARIILVRTEKSNKQDLIDYLTDHFISNKYEVQTLPSTFFTEDIKRVITTERQNVFIFDGSDWNISYKLLQTIANFKSSHPQYTISVVGHNEWQNYAMDNSDILHDANTFILASDFYNAYNKTVIDFEETYKKWFKSYPIIYLPRMGELGYDSGLFMLNALALYGKDFENQEVNANYLQTKFNFERISNNGGYANTNMMFIHYSQNQKIECIELKK